MKRVPHFMKFPQGATQYTSDPFQFSDIFYPKGGIGDSMTKTFHEGDLCTFLRASLQISSGISPNIIIKHQIIWRRLDNLDHFLKIILNILKSVMMSPSSTSEQPKNSSLHYLYIELRFSYC